MDDIEKYYKHGIVGQIFEAEASLIIWDKIAGQIDKYDKQDSVTKKLFSYIQTSSGTNYILKTAKIFDTPNRKYPTRCLLSFFDLIANKTDLPNIENDTGLIKLLKDYNCSTILISKVSTTNSLDFAKEFSLYYRQKYNSEDIQRAIEEVKFARDKYVAHNEHLQTSARVEIKTIRCLLDFATEVITIFGYAFFNDHWTIRQNAEKDTYFIQWTIDKLIKN